jgi:small multidrug resistance pump
MSTGTQQQLGNVSLPGPGPGSQPLLRYRPWFYAAAVYNLVWGAINTLFPRFLFELIGMTVPNYLPLWQVVGMLVLVYAPAYWWVARYPERHRHLVLIGLLGKVLGPVGFAWSLLGGQLPLAFGLTILTNDLIWWPAFGMYLRDAARQSGGWAALLSGE